MGQSFAIDGTPGLLLLALPIVVAALVVIWAVRQSRVRPPKAVVRSEAVMTVLDAKPVAAEPPSAPAVHQQPTLVRAAVDTISASGRADDDLAAAIARCEANGSKAELADLYIKQATVYVAAGKSEDAASRLRDAIRVAALNGLAAPHALARLELGDLYLSNGDPITACEQWQIARNLFHDLKRPEERDNVDKRMLGNGCPTDWVLTDF